MQHQYLLSLPVLRGRFPTSGKYANGLWKSQEAMLEFVAEHGSAVIESPTGTGKTAVEYAILKAAEEKFEGGPFFIVTPNKTILEQIKKEFPDLRVALGRNEHPCLYYHEPKKELTLVKIQELYQDPNCFRADQIPCAMLTDCPHRVDQETGETYEKGAARCPYLDQKYLAKQSGEPVLCTVSFYLFTHLFSQEFKRKGVLVIDEAHRLAEIFRNSLSYEISDYHLRRSIELLLKIDAEEVVVLNDFLETMEGIVRRKKPGRQVLLKDEEIRELIDILLRIDSNALLRRIREAVKKGLIDPKADRTALKQLEVLARDLRRYITSFEYSLETEGRKPLNYTCAFWRAERGEQEKTQYKLIVKCYYVVPLIKKVLPPFRVSFSATIGDKEVFGYETGIKDPLLRLESNFPVKNTRVYLPTDTPNLAKKARNRQDVTRSLRKIARACKRFAKAGQRSLVVVISNAERDKFRMLAAEEGLDVVSYGNGLTAKAAALAFREGQGETLVGTAANYSEGVDLPKQIAPIIFFFRPGYPNLQDAISQFEEKRWGRRMWALWDWRAMHQALQTRGRNIRSRSDVGVTFFISQQFKRILYAALPGWLKEAYRKELTFEECLEDAEKLLEA